jgi:hypothetical protein
MGEGGLLSRLFSPLLSTILLTLGRNPLGPPPPLQYGLSGHKSFCRAAENQSNAANLEARTLKHAFSCFFDHFGKPLQKYSRLSSK